MVTFVRKIPITQILYGNMEMKSITNHKRQQKVEAGKNLDYWNPEATAFGIWNLMHHKG